MVELNKAGKQNPETLVGAFIEIKDRIRDRKYTQIGIVDSVEKKESDGFTHYKINVKTDNGDVWGIDTLSAISFTAYKKARQLTLNELGKLAVKISTTGTDERTGRVMYCVSYKGRTISENTLICITELYI